MVRLCAWAALCALLAVCAPAWSATNLNTNDNSPNMVLFPCSQEEFYISFKYEPLSFQEITIQAKNSSNANQIEMQINNGVLGSDAVVLPPCVVGDGRECSVDLTCELANNNEWFIYVVNRDSDPVEFNITTVSRTLKPTTLTLNTPVTFNDQLSGNDFGSENVFYQIAIQPPSEFAMVNFTLYDIGPVEESSVRMAVVNPHAIASTDVLESTCGAYTLEAPGTLLLTACDLEEVEPDGGSVTWFVSIAPAQYKANFTFTLAVTVDDFVILDLNEGKATPVQFIDNEGDVLYYEIESPPTPADGEPMQQLNITVMDVQGGQVNVSYAANYLPWEKCKPEVRAPCLSETRCDLVVPACDVQQDSYYIAVAAQRLTAQNQPVAFRVNASYANPPTTSSAVKIDNGVYFAGSVLENQYQHFKFSPAGYKTTADSYLDVQLYVDATDFGPTTLFVNPEALAGTTGTSCLEHFAQPCSVQSVGSCVVQLFACDYADFDTWYFSVLGGDAANFFGSGTRFTLRAQLADPRELSEYSVIQYGAVYSGEYDQWVVRDSMLDEGEVVYVEVASVVGGRVSVWENRDQLAGDACETRACYGAVVPSVTVPNNQTGEQSYTMRLARCEDDDEDYYVGVRGVAAPNGAEYTVTLVRDAAPVQPLATITEGQVVTGALGDGDNARINYTLADGGSSKRLVVTLTLLEAPADGAITLGLRSGKYLNCGGGVDSCTTGTGFDGSTCEVVLQPCEFSQLDGAIVELEGAAGMVYNLQYRLYSPGVTSLKSGVAVAGDVHYKQYMFYKFAVSSLNTTLVVEAYFDNDVGAQGSLYVSTSEDPGRQPCYTADSACTDTDKCVYIVNACEIQKTTYYMSVYTRSMALRPYPALKYTLRATQKDAAVPLQFGSVNALEVYQGQRVFHTLEVDSIDADEGEIVAIYLGSVQRGSVSLYVSYGSPLAHCPCFEHTHTLSAKEGDAVQTLALAYCEITQTGTWTLEIVGEAADEAAQLIGYTISVQNLAQEPTPLAIGDTVSGSARNGQYVYYSVDGVGANDQVTLEVSDVRGGAVSVYLNSDHPATAECQRGAACGGTASSCSTQLGACAPSPGFLSVRADSTGAEPVFFNVSLAVDAEKPLTAKERVAVQMAPQFTNIYSFTIPEGTKGPLIQIRVSGLKNGPVVLTASEDLCDPLNAFTQTCNGGGTCTLEIGDCDITADKWLLRVQSTAPANGDQTEFTLVYDLVATATQVFSIPGGALNNTLSALQWRMYQVPVVIDADGPPTTQLTVSVQQTLGALDVYIQSAADAQDYPSVGCYELRSLSCRNCRTTIDACCIQNSTYYVAIRNTLNRTVSYAMQYELTEVAEYASFNVSAPPMPVTASRDTAAEYRFELLPSMFNSSFQYAVTSVRSNDTAALDFYVQRVSAAGDGASSCFTNEFACTGSSACDYQMYPCEAPVTVAGSYLAGVSSADDEDHELTLDVDILSAVPINVTAGFDAQVQVSTQWQFFELVPDEDGDALQTVQVQVARQALDPRVTISYSQESLCDAVSTNTRTCSTNPGPSCGLSIPLCATYGPVVLAVRSDSAAFSNATLTVTLVKEDAVSVRSGDSVTTRDVQTGSVVYRVQLSNETVGATSEFTALVSTEGGAIASVTASFDGPYCFSQQNLCAGRVDADGACHLVIGACRLVAGPLFLRVAVAGAPPSGANVTLDASSGLESGNVTKVALGGAAVGSSVVVFESERFRVDLTAAEVRAGQSVSVLAAPLCGEVALYANDGQFAASADCNELGGAVTGSVLTLDACEVLRHGVPDTAYVTVEGAAQAEGEYNIPVYYTLASVVGGVPINFVTVQAGQTVWKNSTADPLNANVYVFPVDGLGDYAGSTVFEYRGRAGTELVVYFDEPQQCAPGGEQRCNEGAPCAISSCIISQHRNAYFSFAPEWEDGASVTVLRVAPYVRDWDAVKGGVATPQTGAVASVDAEHYRFSVQPLQQDFFRLRIELTVQSGGTASFLWAVGGPPAQGTGCPQYATCEVQGLKCVAEVDACDLRFAEEVFVTVTGGLATATAQYTLSVTTVEEGVEQLKIREQQCVDLGPGEWRWFSADYGAFNESALLRVVASSIEHADDLDVFVNAAAVADEAAPLATDECQRTALAVRADGRLTLEVTCRVEGVATIALHNTRNANNTLFIMWDRVDNGLQQLDESADGPAGVLSQFYRTELPGNMSATEVFVVQLEPAALAVAPMLAASLSAPGMLCAQYTCTGACELSDACNDNRFAGPLYVTVEPQLLPYSVSAGVFDVPTEPLALGDPAESRFKYSQRGAGGGWSSPNRHLYALELAAPLAASDSLELTVYGVNQGRVNVWVSSDRVAESDCALAAQDRVQDRTQLTVAACDLLGSTQLYVVVQLNAAADQCGVDVTYGLFAQVVSEQWTQGGALSSGDAVQGALSVPPAATAYTYSSGNATAGSVLEVLLSYDEAVDAAVAVSGTLYPVRTADNVECSFALTPNERTFITPCELAAADEWQVVVETSGASVPGGQYTLEVREAPVQSLNSAGQVAGSGDQGTQYTVLDVTQTKAAAQAQSLVVAVDVAAGFAVDVSLWAWTCDEPALPLDDFSCFGGECLLTWQWDWERTVPQLGIVTRPASATARYNITYAIGEGGNCMEQPANLTFCAGVGYSWWKYGAAEGLDETARNMFENVYATFCPDCDCRSLTQQCNDTLTRFACEYTLRPCDSGGFQTTMCRDTCTDVEQACGMTFAAAGWPQLECAHNWYATSSEAACSANAFEGFTPSSSSGVFSSSWWIVALIVVAALLLIIAVLVVGALVYLAVRNRPRQYEVISDASGSANPTSNID